MRRTIVRRTGLLPSSLPAGRLTRVNARGDLVPDFEGVSVEIAREEVRLPRHVFST